MAIGFGIFLTLLTWVRFDASFDKFHEDIESMYVLNVRLNMNGSDYTIPAYGWDLFQGSERTISPGGEQLPGESAHGV